MLKHATPRRPRVIFIGPVPPPYIGPTLATVVLLNSKLKDQFELIHLDTSDHRDIGTLGAIDFTNIWLGFKSYIQLLVLLIRYRPELIYVPISQTTLGYLRDSVYIWLSRTFGCKVICQLRGGFFREWIENASVIMRTYVKLTHGLVHGQIVLGECLKPLFQGYVKEHRLFVVPNGKDYGAEHVKRTDRDIVRVLYLANMIREKGVLEVLRACAILGADSRIEFCFAGAWHEEELRSEIEEFLRSYPELPIRWLGSVSGDDKQRAFESADIFVFPTYYPPEGHPWVVIEAMAAGLPVLSTDQGAIRESVIDGLNGYLVEKKNPQDLANKILRLVEDRALLKSMSQASQKRYLQNFSEAKMVEKMANTFRAVLSPESYRS